MVKCKKVYYTSIYQCDQGISDILSIAAIVLDKFKDFPNVIKLYAKSDDAPSYQGNYVNHV